KKRLLMDKGFYERAEEPEKVIENYLYRSEWHNQLLHEQCKAGNHNHLIVKEDTTTDEIVAAILNMLV
ncbi:MAG: hypothetical protein FWD03_06350, partial [Defluviitaleaceae bacterium]|nr:hypothetical protein [Defluviitaleaceae bacterium]